MMTIQQKRKYLRDRLAAAKRTQWYGQRRWQDSKPPEVKAAERVLKAWNDKQNKLSKAHDDKVRAAANEIDEMLFKGGTYEQVLEALKKFEAMKF
jgi:hypothetical protein